METGAVQEEWTVWPVVFAILTTNENPDIIASVASVAWVASVASR